jgi:hypothetical protein
VGRFVSADAYEGTLNDPMSLHDYQYAHANPTNLVDPWDTPQQRMGIYYIQK